MKRLMLAGTLLLWCTAMSCPTWPTRFVSVIVEESLLLPTVPSGSALLTDTAGHLLIVSDDAPFVFRCARDGRVLSSIPVTGLPTALTRIPKPQKPDFEAAVSGTVDHQQCLVAFGSGSLEGVRDSVLILPLAAPGDQRVKSLSPFYAHIRQHFGIAKKDFNIEGAALRGDKFVLFNRGTNHVICCSFKKLMKHLLANGELPKLSGWTVDLPKTGTYITGFSGGDFINEDHLLFCASAEATTDWYQDGEVLGSYIGVLKLHRLEGYDLVAFEPLVDSNGVRVREKLESIVWNSAAHYPTAGLFTGLVDNDDGTSRLLRIRAQQRSASSVPRAPGEGRN